MFHPTLTLATLALYHIVCISAISDGARGVNMTYTRVVQALDAVCPLSTRCTDQLPVNMSDVQVLTDCLGCSLNSSCGTSNEPRCCYMEDDLSADRRRRNKNIKCRRPLFEHSSHDPGAFSNRYHVKTYYIHGERLENDTDAENNCENAAVAPWGSIYPVSVIESGYIYHNFVCAEQDRLSVGEYQFWTPHVLCDLDSPDELSLALEGLTEWPSKCNVYFTTEGLDQSKVDAQLCYDSYSSTCLDKDSIFVNPMQREAGLVAQDMVDLCLSELVAPVQMGMGRRFLNPFCSKCSGFVACGGEQEIPGDALMFSNLLAPQMFTKPRKKEAAPVPQACFRETNGTMITNDCRNIVCPLGKSRSKIGHCIHPKTLSVILYNMILKLKPQSGQIPAPMEYIPAAFVTPIYGLGFKFGIEKVFVSLLDSEDRSPSGDYEATGRFVDYFIVRVVFKNLFDVNLLYYLFNQLLSEEWTYAGIDGVTPLSPSLTRCTDWEAVSDTQQFVPTWYRKENRPDIPLTEQLYQIYEQDLYSEHSMNLNTPFICDRLELYPHEYSLLSEGLVLHNHRTGGHLFDGEFSLTRKLNGEMVALVCVSDSGFVPLDTLNKGCQMLSLNGNLFLAALFMYTLY